MEYLKAEEVCARYRMSERTMYRLIQKDKFPRPMKIGGQNRWPETSLAKWEADQNGAK